MMKKRALLLYSFLSVLIAHTSCNNSHTLFNEDSNNWMVFGDAQWVFTDEEFIGRVKEGNGFVMTNDSYKNFALELEFKPDSTINSGVFIRCANKELSATDCHEINIWDLHPNQDFRTGAIVSKVVPKNYVETLNKWNSYKILAKENRIQVWVNTIKTADSTFLHPPEGYIALQAMGNGEIKFRNIELKEIR